MTLEWQTVVVRSSRGRGGGLIVRRSDERRRPMMVCAPGARACDHCETAKATAGVARRKDPRRGRRRAVVA